MARDGRSDVMSMGVSAFSQWNMSAPVNVDTSVVTMLKDNPEPVIQLELSLTFSVSFFGFLYIS